MCQWKILSEYDGKVKDGRIGQKNERDYSWERLRSERDKEW